MLPMNEAQRLIKSQPAGFHDIVGNSMIRAFFVQALDCGGAIDNVLIVGESGTGKTSSVRLFAQTLRCLQPDLAVRGPCHRCDRCRNEIDGRVQHGGIYALGEHLAVNVLAFHCASLTAPQLGELDRVSIPACRDQVFVLLDEIQFMRNNRLDERMMEIMDAHQGVCWIGTGTDTKGLEPAFLKRFATRLTTEAATEAEFVGFLARRCQEFEIDVPDPNALQIIASRTECAPRDGLQVLARALQAPGRALTMSLAQSVLLAA